VIRLIIFDAGGVLYEGSSEIVDHAIRKFLEKHGVHDLKKSNEVWSRIDKLASVGKISLREAHCRWLEGLGLPKGLVDEWEEVDKNEIWKKFRRITGINRLLGKLKKKYVLVVLSDTFDSKQEKIENMKIVGVNYKCFSEIFTSHDLGVCKPSRKAFLTILKRFDVKPKEALFIGDACDELMGARKIGLTTIGFKCDCGDYNVKNLNEIGRILQKLN
jgi:HAD superfamily hydrolase (TIGR01549 family)